eukprot:c16873_g1_i2.p1 GENE.c16873_g1_i2~~c16873_g1_i2.p1  ORF type:complete len:898 (+),score=222.66 c16873_g1_i2:34-2694(+)
MPKPFSRLPKTVVPQHYNLNYTNVDLDNHRFEGVVNIDVEVVPASGVTEITLHALELFIKSATARSSAGLSKVTGINLDLDLQTVTLVFSAPVSQGKGLLTIEFEGVLNDKLHGFYRSSYTDLDGTKRIMAVTQFEATDARRALPCWDEPAIKASFELSITTRSDRLVISNTPVIRCDEQLTTRNALGRETSWTFAPTPKMSTYLLAVVVGEFGRISSRTESGVEVTVYTPLGKASQGTFAQWVAVKSLDYYEKLFGIPYPLAKSDLLAIPDFAAGAMENWGCVTYREARLLVDEKKTSVSNKLAIARTVAHELAHQWFGNLVTMEWWTHLWLNEGFARFMEFLAVNHVFPEWRVWDEFVYSVFNTALSLDMLASSHPVEVPVNHPDEINEIFDTISYAKGASVIRMLACYIGIDTFMAGLKSYLTHHAYSNAETHHLWDQIAAAAKIDVATLMSAWTSRLGYPLVTVSEPAEKCCNLSQQQFIASRSNKQQQQSVDKNQAAWIIPLTVLAEGATEAESTKFYVLDKDTAELGKLLASLDAQGKWFKLNGGQTSFCRVNYTPKQWTRLGLALSKGSAVLSASDRLGVVGDCFSLAATGHVSPAQPLDLARQLKNDPDYIVWAELCDRLVVTAALYREEPFFPRFQKFMIEVCEATSAHLGWDKREGEDERSMPWRNSLLSVLRFAEHEPTRTEATKRFQDFTSGKSANAIAPDLRFQTFRIAALAIGAPAWDELLKVYRTSNNVEERTQALQTLGMVPGCAEKTIDWILNSGEVRSQDISSAFLGVCASAAGKQAAWDLMSSSYDDFVARYGGGLFVWSNLVKVIVGAFNSHAKADEIEAFFADPAHPLGNAKRGVDQTIESIRLKADRLERDREVVGAWLAEKGY